MEGDFRSESPPPPMDVVCISELKRANSDASTLTAENCEDILHHSAINVKPDDNTIWTDEKHSLYLELLEVSFVKQLHQSRGLLMQCSEQNKRDKNISQIPGANAHNGSGQYGSWQKINYKKGNPLSSVTADSYNPHKVSCVGRFKRVGIHCPPAPPDVRESFALCSAENHEQEGTGQNFVDEDIQNKSNTEYRVKRLKTALADSSSHDQATPAADY